jgi:hypothetical protein
VTAPAHAVEIVDVIAIVNSAKSLINAPADQFSYS